MARASLLVSATHVQGKQHGTDNEFFAGVTYAFDRGITGSLFTRQSQGKVDSVAQVQKSPPLGPGFGYRVQGEVGEQNRGSGLLRYQGDYGIYEASFDHGNDQNTVTLNASGSLVAIGGRVFPARPVYDSFALIRVPGVPDVPGYVSNQEVGRTDAHGDLVVPNLLSYYGNRIGIGVTDVPMEYSIDTSEHIVAPPFRGGALVTFAALRGQHVTGALLVDVAGQSVIPAYGQLTVLVESTPVSSPLGKGGEFYFEHLAGGQYPATVEYAGGRCQFTLAVPVADTPFVQLGTLHCDIL
jgi:outer membrane usher protein